MQAFLDFFELMPVWQKLVWLISALGFFWILEGAYAFSNFSYRKWAHARTNFIFLFLTIIINTLFGLFTLGLFEWEQQIQLGLLYWFELPVWIEMGITLLVLGFIAQFGIHYLLHKNKWLWRLHTVHHSDTYLDVTSGTRHHPIDFIFRELAALLAVIITGMPIAFYRIITILLTYWTHANIRLPEGVDRLLSRVIVTPGLHRFHHHHKMPVTDTNYGNILSIWDQVFGMFYYGDPKEIVFSLDITDSSQASNVNYQLKLPFNKNISFKK